MAWTIVQQFDKVKQIEVGMELREVYGPRDISAAVRRLATRINSDYHGRDPVMVGVLKGSFIFLSDLVRLIKAPVEIDFIYAASYGCGTVSSGRVAISEDLTIPVLGRDVIVVEDIVDTGHTLKAVIDFISDRKPASLRVCALLDKPSRREVGCAPDYVGLEVEDMFLVGYGLDCAERYRNLKGLYELVDGPDG